MDFARFRVVLGELGVKPEQYGITWVGGRSVIRVGVHTYPIPSADCETDKFAVMIANKVEHPDKTGAR